MNQVNEDARCILIHLLRTYSLRRARLVKSDPTQSLLPALARVNEQRRSGDKLSPLLSGSPLSPRHAQTDHVELETSCLQLYSIRPLQPSRARTNEPRGVGDILSLTARGPREPRGIGGTMPPIILDSPLSSPRVRAKRTK